VKISKIKNNKIKIKSRNKNYLKMIQMNKVIMNFKSLKSLIIKRIRKRENKV
jgi:hypothetical protein